MTTTKIKEIYLYSNGIGFFHGVTKESKLFFKVKYMNDVLKTIKIKKENNPLKVLTFSSPKDFKNYQIPILSSNPYLSLVKSLKGKEVTIEDEIGKYKGLVLGVDEIEILDLESKKIKKFFVTILEGSKIKKFNLFELKSIDINEKNANSVKSFLKDENSNKENSVIQLNIIGNENENEISHFYYTRPTAIWKIIYKINYDLKTLKTFAIIDNDTNYDWKGVKLNLVSEHPKTVFFPLFEIFKKRESHQEESLSFKRMSKKSKSNIEMEYEVTQEDIGITSGSFKSFIISNLKINSMESAKVFLASFKVELKKILKISSYSTHYQNKNPQMVISMISKDSLSVRGPVTIYNKEKYLGESIINKIPKDDELSIPYAVDVQCEVYKSKKRTRIDFSCWHLKDLILILKLNCTTDYKYQIKYNRDATINLIIEHFLHYDLKSYKVKELKKESKEEKEKIIEKNKDDDRLKIKLKLSQGKTGFVITENYITTKTFILKDINDFKDFNKKRDLGFESYYKEFESYSKHYKERDFKIKLLNSLTGKNFVFEKKIEKVEEIENKIKILDKKIENFEESINKKVKKVKKV